MLLLWLYGDSKLDTKIDLFLKEWLLIEEWVFLIKFVVLKRLYDYYFLCLFLLTLVYFP